MTNRISEAIVRLLEEGKNSSEIISMGYKKGTVYGTQRKWHQGKAEATPGVNSKAGPADPTVAVTPESATTSPEIESDPEIVQLKKDIRKAELEKQLGRLRAPLEMETMVSAAQEVGPQRQEECTYEEEGVCTLREWSTEAEVPKGIGEAISEDGDTWRIKPSPIYCAMCIASVEGATEAVCEELDSTPILGLHERFFCECGTRGMVAVAIKCTKCGKSSWWGWWPKNG